MGKVGIARQFLKSPVSGTRQEHLAMAAITGVSIGTVNNQLNQHYLQKSKNAYYRRKLKSGRTVLVKKAPNHGVGLRQIKTKVENKRNGR